VKPDPRFAAQSKEFWANVRTISQELGYTQRGAGIIKVPSLAEVLKRYATLGLSAAYLGNGAGELTSFGSILFDYFAYRANVLNDFVRVQLMNKTQAEVEFLKLQRRLKPICPLPMNKQKGDKKNHAFLTGIVNMLVHAALGDEPCDYDPRSLTTLTHDNMPLRTLSRRVDGAYPSVVNPIAIWEVKEHYYTTTFGSRVADGVYETLLDGMELAELELAAQRKVQHVLFVDDYFTWWECGRSYLCRIIDMLHMGYVDDVLFGRETITVLPALVAQWRSARIVLTESTQ
jgi:hypothetical protein